MKGEDKFQKIMTKSVIKDRGRKKAASKESKNQRIWEKIQQYNVKRKSV